MSDFGTVLEMQSRQSERVGRWYGWGLGAAILVTIAFVLGWAANDLAEELQIGSPSAMGLLSELSGNDFLQLSGLSAGMATWLGARAWNAHQQKMVLLIARALDLEGEREAALNVLVKRIAKL